MTDQARESEISKLLFPADRKVLYVREVAKRLRCTEQHVSDLIEEGQLAAVNVAGGGRKSWRIPVEAWEAFLRKRNSLNLPLDGSPKKPGVAPRRVPEAKNVPTRLQCAAASLPVSDPKDPKPKLLPNRKAK